MVHAIGGPLGLVFCPRLLLFRRLCVSQSRDTVTSVAVHHDLSILLRVGV